MKVRLGDLTDGSGLNVDIQELMRTRLLIQANSGGGKSWLLRRFAEQVIGKVPIIIIDPEGEFATLREKHDFVLVGKGGDTPADLRSAELVAHRLLELRACAVIDVYEMKPASRHEYIKLFLDSMINAPKNLWRPTIVVVDEGHKFCPEKGAGESVASEAIISLCTTGRKRGFCAVIATQRLGKLRKDASAELLNRLVGMTFEDVDLDRVGDVLSIPRAERVEFYTQMKTMEPGMFWAFGRALTRQRTVFMVGKIQTSHPDVNRGSFSAEPPPPPEKIRQLLPKLADLPKEAEEKLKTVQDLTRRIRELESEARRAPKVELAVDEEAIREGVVVGTRRVLERANKRISQIDSWVTEIRVRVAKVSEVLGQLPKDILHPLSVHSMDVPKVINRSGLTMPPKPRLTNQPVAPREPGEKLSAAVQNILDALAWWAVWGFKIVSREQVAFVAGYSPNSGHFTNSLGAARTRALLDYPGSGLVSLTPAGDELAVYQDGEPTLDELKRRIDMVLGEAHRRILYVLWDGNEWTRDDLAAAAKFSANSGHFTNTLGRLSTLTLCKYPRPGVVVLADWIKELS